MTTLQNQIQAVRKAAISLRDPNILGFELLDVINLLCIIERLTYDIHTLDKQSSSAADHAEIVAFR